MNDSERNEGESRDDPHGVWVSPDWLQLPECSQCWGKGYIGDDPDYNFVCPSCEGYGVEE